MASGKKTGGRKKGSRNKRTEAQAAKIDASGLTPLEYMLSVLRDTTAEQWQRFQAARDAAPYCHAKLTSSTLDGKFVGKMIVEWSKSEE